jgi:hypothetical protein
MTLSSSLEEWQGVVALALQAKVVCAIPIGSARVIVTIDCGRARSTGAVCRCHTQRAIAGWPAARGGTLRIVER